MSSIYVTENNTRLGSGAFSTVYKGYNKNNPGVTLAIKVLKMDELLKQYGDVYKKYLQREIETMKTLRNHPNIVCLDEVEHVGNLVYIGMEYCESDLKKYLYDSTNKEKLLSEEEAQVFMRQIANGLKFMGGQAIAHRDLKPQNILMSKNGSNIILKIADFGFARTMAKDSMNMKASQCGTPLYMAPEIKKQVYSDTCDLWSLGLILFEMMFGFNKMKNCIYIISSGGIAHVLPKNLSANCFKLFEDLLQVDPAKRIPWLDFFNHPFLYEPHPEVSLLKPPEPNTVQVFSFPSLKAVSLVLLEDDIPISEWKKANGLAETSVAVLCRDTDSNRFNEPSKWSGVELKELESIGVYQIGTLGTANQCIFVFDDQEAMSADLLLDPRLRDAPTIVKPTTELDRELYLQRCRNAVEELYDDVVYVYDICTTYVLTRELLRYGNMAIRAASKTRRENLDAEYQQIKFLLEPSEGDWKRAVAGFTESKSAVEMFPGISLPAFLRPTAKAVEELIVSKQNEFDALKAQHTKIKSAFGRAEVAMSSWKHSALKFVEFKEELNGRIYEFKRNVSHFLSMLEASPNNNQVTRQVKEGDEPPEVLKARILLEYSLDLNRRVREFYQKLVATLRDTDELIDQTKKAVEYHRLLTRLKGDVSIDMSFYESAPCLTREVLEFTNTIKPVMQFIELPTIVNRFMRLLHDRQKYEKQIQSFKFKTDSLLNNLYSRHRGLLDKFFNGHLQQLGVLFPGYTQLSPLPSASLVIVPSTSLEGYPDIPSSVTSFPTSPHKEDHMYDLEDEFSIIVKEETTISSVLHDNAQLAQKLRDAEHKLEDASDKLRRAEAAAGVGSGELARRVQLHEKIATLKNSQGLQNLETENRTLNEQLKKANEEISILTKLHAAPKPPQDYDFQLRARLRAEWEVEAQANEEKRKAEKEAAEEVIHAMNHTIDQQSKEIEEQKTIMAVEVAKIEEERNRVQEERATLHAEQKRITAEAQASTQETQDLRARLESMRVRDTQAQEIFAKETQDLRAELEAMRAQLATAQQERELSQERILALESQRNELRDEVLAYKLAYSMDEQQQQLPQAAPPAPQNPPPS